MAKKGNFVYIHRKIMDWEWYKDPNTFRVFLHLILRANWKPARYKGRQIMRGQTFASYRTLGEELDLSVQELRTALDHLEATGEATRKQYPDGLIITVKNYDLYQPSNTLINTLSTDDQHAINNDRIKDNKLPKKEKNIPSDSEEISDEEWGRMMDDGTI